MKNKQSHDETLEEMKQIVKKMRADRYEHGYDTDNHNKQWVYIGSLYRTLPTSYQKDFDDFVC